MSYTAAATWSTFAKLSYASRRPPVTATFAVDRLEQAARKKLEHSSDAYMYIFGSAGTGSTAESNRAAFKRWKIIPRLLRDVSKRNIEVTLFGNTYPSPLLLAPIGAQGIVHAEGERATAAAAGGLGIPFIMSTGSTRSIEAIAKANGPGPRWLQLYWGKNDGTVMSLLSRAKAAGFTALVVTVDTPTIGWRPCDLDTAYLPFAHGVGAQVGLTDPFFMAAAGLEPFPEDEHPDFPYIAARQDELIRNGDKKATLQSEVGQKMVGELLDPTKVWGDLSRLKEQWGGPLILKGILSPKDAELAIENGVDGIIVSNHGGRQIDGSISSLDALHRIMGSCAVKEAQARGTFTILLDSGIRTGSDIFKALALGAQGVCYGRPYMYALALAGREGVDSQLRAVLADFEITLGLAGVRSIEELRINAHDLLVRDWHIVHSSEQGEHPN
ncbi:oxidoreductase [Fomitopsis serialis]|uniref:oxidoreductase n=1 Tax=Fomitopsis serialis TaxID=139415 RepID=UPI002007F38C|nr:oxidoreductase [Neoantrodia serialis]KAH9934311.1 oxidoreductase [Neoantrodia serialis]